MMANINKVFLLPPADGFNNHISYKSEKNFNKVFHYFDKHLQIKVDDNEYIDELKNKKKKIKLRMKTNLSTERKKTYYTEINKNDYNDINNDYLINSKNIEYKTSKEINMNKIKGLLFRDKNNNLKTSPKQLEENKININFNNKIKNKKKKKIFFTNGALSSFSKDMFNIKMNLHNAKNFSLYRKKSKKKLLSNSPNPSKKIIREYQQKKIIKNKFFYPYQTKYIFKNQEALPLTKFKGLPDSVKKMNKYYMEAVKFDSTKFFDNNFSILRKEQFSANFRNPLLNNNLLSDDRKIITEEKYKEIREEIIAGKEILNEINRGKNINLINNRINVEKIFFKFKIWIIKFAEYVKLLDIKPILYIEMTYKLHKSRDLLFYETQHIKTSEIIKAIKSKNKNLTSKLIEEYPHIVLSKDYFGYTPLHWVVKQKCYNLIANLVLYGANINDTNFIGDTPLHSAIKNNDYECTVLLLIFMANPFIKNRKGEKPFDMGKDYQMNIIRKRIENLYYINTYKRSKVFINNIQNKFINFIKDEFKTQLSKECLDIIEEFEKDKEKKLKQEK